MKEGNGLNDWLKKTREFSSGVIALITSAAALVIAIRGEPSLYKVLIAIAILVFVSLMCLYIAFSRTGPVIPGGKGTYRFERYRISALMGIGAIAGIVVAFTTIQSNRAFVLNALSGSTTTTAGEQGSLDKMCNQISITPAVRRLTLPAPMTEDVYAGVVYELKAPTETGVRVLFHMAQHLMHDGEREVEIVMGRHFTHGKIHVPAGKSELLQEGVLLGTYDTENAKKYGTVIVTQRLTFHIASDNGIYCEIVADDLEVEMTGLTQ